MGVSALAVLLFIQNNSKFKNRLKHACKPLSMFIGKFRRLGTRYKGLFSAANILQIAEIVF